MDYIYIGINSKNKISNVTKREIYNSIKRHSILNHYIYANGERKDNYKINFRVKPCASTKVINM